MEKFKTRGSDGIEQMKSLNYKQGHNQHDLQCLWKQNQDGSYVGIVTEIFARGGLLELDCCVWLLLTHQPPCQICGLRVGARLLRERGAHETSTCAAFIEQLRWFAGGQNVSLCCFH
ncbi:hypothetical protein GOP47_0011616 [Adiantum capillus-veneris]|uniref:Uncharacterized protein n=1 Tax=Adiantum capillus-veneris TaxID=13818 RepID=A0A9D4UT42_ADICA|nr:hypothetical protein GOP47_0011616 [Adiantum capillus-veneris]